MQLRSIAWQATSYPERVVNNGLHLMDRDVLREASRQTRPRSAPGVEQVTAKPYAENLEDTLRALHERLRDKRYVAPPVERGWLDKDEGTKRPLGNSCCEDKSVQRAVVMSLAAMLEPDFPALSHGVWKGHRQHQAVHEVRAQGRQLPIAWRVDAAVRGVVDTRAWRPRRACMRQRGNEGGMLRRIGTWLHAGGLASGALSHPDRGTPQGGAGSPM